MLRYLFLLTLLFSVRTYADEITKITVRDANFEIVKTLEFSSEIKSFSEIWSSKIKIGATEYSWTHKLDFLPGGRWLYNCSGRTAFLSKTLIPMYKIPDPSEFNKLLGIVECASKEKSK